MAGKIEFDADLLKLLKVALALAKKHGEEEFTFEGHELYVPYAEYLVEYLDGRLSQEGSAPKKA